MWVPWTLATGTGYSAAKGPMPPKPPVSSLGPVSMTERAPSSKLPPGSHPDRPGASSTTPSSSGPGDNRTQAYTYFTRAPKPGEQPAVLYNGDRLWVRVKLMLETAGPVVVGQSASLLPINSGKGILLPTNQQIEIVISKGSRLYIAASGVNRVKVVIEPIPWLEQITGSIAYVAQTILSMVRR